MKFKIAELLFEVDRDTEDIENVIQIEGELEVDCKNREDEIIKALEPVFELFKDIIRNSEEE